MKQFSRRFQRGVSAAIVAVACTVVGAASANAAYPEREITLIVPFPAGGAVDAVARLFSAHVGEPFKGRVVVVNRPGASGVIGETAMARANPDGYTILFHAASVAVNASIYKQPLYDPDELQPVAMAMALPFVVATNDESGIKALGDVKAVAAKEAEGLTTAYAGITTRLAAELYKIVTDDNLYMVAYNGGPAATLSLIRNETKLYFSDITSLASYISAGQLRALAVTSRERLKQFPDVPTTAEVGLPRYAPETWFGVFTRKGTPPNVLAVLNKAVNDFSKNPEVVQKIEEMGGVPQQMSVAEFEKFYREQRVLWQDVIKRAEIPLQ